MMENTEIIKTLRLCAKSGNVIDYCELGDNNDCLLWDNCGDCIDNLLRAGADALEAAEQRIKEFEAQLPKEGEWIGIDGTMFSECSVCRKRHYGCETPYCDMCGARMKGEQNEQ